MMRGAPVAALVAVSDHDSDGAQDAGGSPERKKPGLKRGYFQFF